MISDQSEFRVQIRKLSFVMIRTSYRWICNHPFLLGFVGFLYFLHRYCPLLFSPLVSASPVLVCTFVLLGTILSFGETNVPEIEKESEIKHEAALFRTEISRDVNATVVERGDKSYTVESFLSKEKNVVEDGNDDADRVREKQLSEVEDDGRPFDYTPLVDETLDASKQDSHVRFEEKAFVLELEKRGESVEEILNDNSGKHGSREEQSRRNGGSLDEIVDDSKEDDQLDVSPISPWRPMRSEDDDDDDADRDDSLDSESDGAESSSPDASMTDIIPMLDELHPLLHSETPIRGIADGEGSDAASEGASRTSSDEGMESDVDSESHGEEGDNENEKEEEEVEKKEDKDDESKSAIKWTEADQRNVMDLGSLELERNQRLENLIARRRARHNMRLMAERNLIDFDSADIPFNMPPISTARQNPFDASYDYDDMGLPPIPGSAPSTMFARRNPFDLPYEPNEEKPDLKGDGFQEEFPSQQPKEPVFRRHESFSVGPSMLGGHRQDRLRPFFVLERLANEGTSYYPFERQLSEVSESKVSSVPDTESVCTVLEDDDKKVDERYTDRETEIDKVDMASDHDEEKSHPASDHDEGKTHMASGHDEEKSQSASDHDEEKSHPASDHDEEKSHTASDHDEEKSHSSEDSDFDEQADSRKLHHDVAEIILGSGETQHEQSNMMEEETSDKSKLDEDNHSDSDSSFSEKEEKIPDISEGEAMLISDQKVDLQEESGASSQPSFRELEIHGRGLEDDNNHDEFHGNEYFVNAPELDESAIHDLRNLVDVQHKEPVYDSSPSGSRFPSFSSVSSDYKPDLPGKNREVVEENEEKKREVGETSTHATGDASLFISEVGIDGHNKSVVEQSPGEDQVPTRVVFSRNITFHEYHDAPEDAAELSCLTSDSSSSPAESPEYTTPMVGEGSRADFFQEVVYDELDHVAERLDQLTDLHEISQSPPEEITEEEDEIKEMDEVLLSELDTVGDFSVKEVVTDSEPGPSSIGPDASNELTEALPVVEARSLEDIDSASQQIHEGSEVEYVILPNTVQDQLDQENCGNSTDTESDVSLLQSTSKEDLENAMNQAVEESMSKQPKSPQSEGESGEIKCEVETKPSESLVEERSLDETNVPLNNIAEKEEEESIPEETTTTTTTFHVSPVLTRALEEIPKLSEPTEAPGPSNLSDEVVTEEAKSENAGKTDANTVQDQLAQENCEISKDTGSDLEVVEATSKDDLENAMNQAVVEGMSMQPKSPESDGGSREIKCEVETKPSETLVEARSLDETNAPLNNKAEKEEEESIPKESTTDVSPVETRAVEEIQKPSEPKEEMSMELISERVVIPTEAAGPSNVPLSDEVMAEKETQGSTDANVQILKSPPLESLVEEQSLDEKENIPKERTTEVSPVETQAPEEIPKPSEPKEEMSMEVSSERVVIIPTEVAGPSNVTLSDEVVTEEAKSETPGNADANVQSLESKETSEGNIAAQKRKEGEDD